MALGMLQAVSAIGNMTAAVITLNLGNLETNWRIAYFIGAIACYEGLTVTGGADGVGRATTRTVVAASITVLVSDFFLTKLFMIAT